MAEVARNGSPCAGVYLLGAVILVVAALAAAGFGGKNDPNGSDIGYIVQDVSAESVKNGSVQETSPQRPQ